MKILRILPIAVIAMATLSQADSTSTAAPIKFATDKEKYSYAIGLDVGESLKRIDYSLDMFQLYKGINDMLLGDSTKLVISGDERKAVLNDLMEILRKNMATKDSLASLENIKKNKEFLAKNKTVKGVITTASGLQYTILKKGTGASPKSTDSVTAHYVGTLLDGKEFDSSVKRGQPATFSLANVIKGWQEVLPLMKVGEKIKCWIPSELAYGERGNSAIPPNSLLIFEIELISLPGAQQPATVPAAKPAAATTAKPAATAPAAKKTK